MRFSDLIAKNGRLSIGRVFLWISFLIMCVYWLYPFFAKADYKDAPESLVTMLISLLLYEFGKKGRDAFSEYMFVKNNKQVKNDSPQQ